MEATLEVTSTVETLEVANEMQHVLELSSTEMSFVGGGLAVLFL